MDCDAQTSSWCISCRQNVLSQCKDTRLEGRSCPVQGCHRQCCDDCAQRQTASAPYWLFSDFYITERSYSLKRRIQQPRRPDTFLTGDNQQRHDGPLQPRKAPVQIKSKFLPSPDNGKAHFLDYGIVLFSMEQISARIDDNTLLGGTGALEKETPRPCPLLPV